MPENTNHSYMTVYESVLEPWTRLASAVPEVIKLRLSAMPWLWLLDPMKALRETERMVTEKHEAWNETLFAISQTPVQLFFDTMCASWGNSPHSGFNKALINSSRRVARPSNSRVRANEIRLTG